MSWSFYAIGSAPAVLAKARKDLSKIKCTEPEETIKGKVLHILEAALHAFPESYAVRVSALGSQLSEYDPSGKTTGKVHNTLEFKIEPIWNFLK